MVQTVAQYLSSNYGIVNRTNVTLAFRRNHIDIDSVLAASTHEFMCDALWWTDRNRKRFLEALASNRFDRDGSDELFAADYRHCAHACAQAAVDEVTETWRSRDRDSVPHQFRDAAVDLCADFLCADVIPCDEPWRVVRACQVNPDLAKLLRTSREVAVRHDIGMRKHHYDCILMADVTSLLNVNAFDARLRDPKTRDSYLQAARAVLKLDGLY